MTDLGMTIFIAWFVIGGFLLLSNRDLFSPSKMLHLFLLIGFLGVFFNDETVAIYLTYIVLLLSGLFIGIYEAISLKNNRLKFKKKTLLIFSQKQKQTLILLLWLGTSVPILAQLYMITSFGGIFNYLLSLTLRVKEFGGWGPVIAIIKFMFVINIIYFTILVFSNSLTKKAVLLFAIHTCLTVGIGLLSGSRGTILGNFLAMMIIFNYWGRPISIKVAISSAILLIVVATILGEVRSGGLSISDNEVNLVQNREVQSFSDRAKTSTTFNAGLVGIRLIYEQNVHNQQYGLTLLATLTNLIPSNIWKNKPKTGGLILTQEYTGDAWGGFSNLSTGIIAEFMINFGMAPGLIFGIFFLIIIFLLFNNFYLMIRSRQIQAFDFKSIFTIISYVWLLRAITGLLTSEFANTFIVLILQIVSLFAIMGILKVIYWTVELTRK